MKLLSQACEYALRAVVWMARCPDQARKVREIAEATNAAPGYMVKVLQSLAKAGILSAQRGSNGGFRLQRDPAGLSLLEIINAVDPIERIEACPLGLNAHGCQLCPMHQQIDDSIAAIEASFGNATVGDLIKKSTQSESFCDALASTSASPTKPTPE